MEKQLHEKTGAKSPRRRLVNALGLAGVATAAGVSLAGCGGSGDIQPTTTNPGTTVHAKDFDHVDSLWGIARNICTDATEGQIDAVVMPRLTFANPALSPNYNIEPDTPVIKPTNLCVMPASAPSN